MRQAFISRVMLESYKSIEICDVPLTALTFLVGPNGSGKSNFLDALRFVSDSLRSSLEHALRERGGFDDVRRRSVGHSDHFAIRLEFNLRDGSKGYYAFQIGARYPHGYEVQIEECSVQAAGLTPSWFKVREGQVSSSSPTVPPASLDRLHLVNAAGLPEFRAVYDAFSRMGFYSLNPDRIREFQIPDAGDLLARDGSNIASVLERIEKHDPAGKRRIEEYLRVIVPGIQRVASLPLPGQRALEFWQQVEGSAHPWSFLARNVSDGTLRSLGVLVSLYQSSNGDSSVLPLVGIEEPETGLHPAAVAVLLDSIVDVSDRAQVIATSHSPAFLDDKELPVESVLAVLAENGRTQIAHLDEVGRSALRDRLYTAGELLSMDQLRPDPVELLRQPKLFTETPDDR